MTELIAAAVLLVGPAPLAGPAVAWGDAQHAWAGGGGGIVATTNGGRTWHVQSRRAARDIDAADASHAWALSRDLTLRTTDGVHWRSLGAQGLLRLSFVDRSNGFAIERLYYLLLTRDGGVTWTPMDGPKRLQALCFVDARTGWVARDGTVWTTHDGGTRWTRRTLMRVRHELSVPDLYCHGDDVWLRLHGGAAAGTEGYTIFRSLDGGATWRAVFASFSTRLPQVSAYSGPIAAFGAGGAVLQGSCPACDAGSVTFVRVPGRRRTTLKDLLPGPFAFSTRSRGLAVLTPAPRGVPTIYRTTDGGLRWRRVFASALLRP